MSRHGLPTIIQHYDFQRTAQGLHVLSLNELHLGTGFVPMRGLEEWFGGDTDYLSLLTDRRVIRSLKLSNILDFQAQYDNNEKSYRGVDSAVFKKAIYLSSAFM